MSVTVAIDNITASSCRFTYSGIDPAAVQIESQISPRPDFMFCACPLFLTGIAGPYTIPGLNRAQTYFVRSRGITGAGGQLAWSAVRSFRTAVGVGQDLTEQAVFLEPAIVCIPETVLNLTATAEVAGYPVTNLLDDGPSVAVLGEAAANTFRMTFELSGAPVDTFALLSTSLPEAVQVKLSYGASKAEAEAETSVAFDTAGRASPNLPGRMAYHLFNRFAEVSAKWFQLEIVADCMGDRMQAGHLVIGKGMVSKRIARDKSASFEDLGIVERNQIGVPDRQYGLRTRTVDFDIAMMNETIYETTYGMLHARVGETDPVLVLPNSKQGIFLHDRLLYGMLSGGREANPVSKYYSRRFQITSII